MTTRRPCEPSRQDPGPGYCPMVAEVASQGGEGIRAAEVIAALSLATDLGIDNQLEGGDTIGIEPRPSYRI